MSLRFRAALVSLAAFLLSTCSRSPFGAPARYSLSPATGGGLDQIFTIVFSDPPGNQLEQARFLINRFADGRQACYVMYGRRENAFYLVSDTGYGSTRMTAGNASELSNSQCRLAGRGSSASISGKSLKLVLDLHFNLAFTGERNVFLATLDASGGATPFQEAGRWRVGSCSHNNSVPSVESVTPSSGGGTNETFTITYTSSGGASDLVDVRALINRTASGLSACYVAYDPQTGDIGLEDDGARQFMRVPLKSGETLANSQCTISTAGSSVSRNASSLIWRLAVTLKPSFAGRKNFYLSAQACSENETGLQKKGTWAVPYGSE